MTDADVKLRLERLTGAGVRECRAVGGQHGVSHHRLALADGRTAFAKLAPPGDRGETAAPVGRGAGSAALVAAGFEAEARGLIWLRDAVAVPVPEVLGWDEAALVIAWVPEQGPDRQSAERFGRDLARLHVTGADAFGTPWPGFIAGLPLGSAAGTTPGNTAGTTAASTPGNDAGESWPEWYARERLLPYARRARDAGTLTATDVRLIETVAGRAAGLAGPPEPPSRIHGDCWSGNVLWSGGRGWLIDPAAHGGHRETDLAMLALFGAPYLDRILGRYQEEAPLAAGWRDRVPLHQLHPLLVHVCLFGTAYREAALGAARAALA